MPQILLESYHANVSCFNMYKRKAMNCWMIFIWCHPVELKFTNFLLLEGSFICSNNNIISDSVWYVLFGFYLSSMLTSLIQIIDFRWQNRRETEKTRTIRCNHISLICLLIIRTDVTSDTRYRCLHIHTQFYLFIRMLWCGQLGICTLSNCRLILGIHRWVTGKTKNTWRKNLAKYRSRLDLTCLQKIQWLLFSTIIRNC